MSRLIVGLGNPGEKYKKTRHNAGFLVVDLLQSAGTMSEVDNVILFKPRTGMNSSGKAVRRVVEEKGIDFEDLLVVHDDMDIDLGDYKLQKGRGAAGHNGVGSIVDSLNSKDFWRLRIGIGRPPEGVEPADYVLEEFSGNELRMLESLIEGELIAVIRKWIND